MKCSAQGLSRASREGRPREPLLKLTTSRSRQKWGSWVTCSRWMKETAQWKTMQAIAGEAVSPREPLLKVHAFAQQAEVLVWAACHAGVKTVTSVACQPSSGSNALLCAGRCETGGPTLQGRTLCRNALPGASSWACE